MKTAADTAAERREFLKRAGTGVAAVGMLSTTGAAMAAGPGKRAQLPNGADNFYVSDKVTVQKVGFKNQYRMSVAGNLFLPKSLDRKKQTAALVVGHPMGAVKEQSANLYATKMAEQGFVTLSLDFQKGKKSVNVKVDGQTIFNSTTLMLQAALDGLGFAYVPFDLMKPHIDAGRLVPVLEDWWPRFPGYHLYYANRRQIAPALALVIDALRYRETSQR